MLRAGYAILMAGMLIAATLSGCNSRINQENYDRLEVGMEYGQVVELLGEPDNCDSAMMANSCTWENEEKQINVKFVDGRVVLFSGNGL
ncbi:MAG: DUF3862 domain-containing protein [Desulfobacteraceae bacterium]|nr:DUF3862 domain-containing protein [Desulfobacteraceae bacterium]